MGIVLTDEMNTVEQATHSGQSLLVLGRAGTGKSTLLQLLRKSLDDRGKLYGVVAPTGIAALNVGGETFHKFFGFRQNLLPSLADYRPPNHLRDVEVLIIDEISMVRADYFDMMSRALSRAKHNLEPFGGTQVVMFGDLFQLPPVIQDADTEVLGSYSTGFFFSSDAFRALTPKSIELSRVFRQADHHFVDLLNNVRHASSVHEALERLNERVREGESSDDGPAVTIVPSNRLADAVNAAKLASLNREVYEVQAEVEGDLSLQDYKVPAVIRFAVGAQVMMAVNSEEYVNGTTGVITAIDARTNEVEIEIDDNAQKRRVYVEPHRWEVWRKTREEAVLVGAITQLPFRLAWAITVHRSQGQTFDKVVFDRDRGMFDSGQLYVALSRCRTLEGLTLRRPIRPSDVQVNADVVRFLRAMNSESVDLSDSKTAVIGFLETDAGEHGRLLEIAIAAFDANDSVYTFSTVVNPRRDFDHSQSGLTPSDVTLAPTVEEIRPFIALLLAGRHVVGFRASRLQNHLQLEDQVDEEGLWVEAQIADSTRDAVRDADSAESALALILDSVEGGVSKPKSVAVGEFSGRLPTGFLVLDRNGFTNIDGLAEWLRTNCDSERDSALAALLLGHPDTAMVAACRGTYGTAGLDRALRSGLEGMVAAVSRDGRVTEAEVRAVRRRSELFGLEMPPLERRSPLEALGTLEPGTGICLTGGTEAQKDRFRSLIMKHGFREVKSVTRSRCGLVVAKDAASGSRKAKTAIEYGIPILSWDEFLSLLSDTRAAENVSEQLLESHTSTPMSDGLEAADVPAKSDSLSDVSPAAVRSWARKHGHPVGTRGRIPRWIVDQYKAALVEAISDV